MTTLTVNIEDKKTEKAIKAVLDAFGLDYNVDQHANTSYKVAISSEFAKEAKRIAKNI